MTEISSLMNERVPTHNPIPLGSGILLFFYKAKCMCGNGIFPLDKKFPKQPKRLDARARFRVLFECPTEMVNILSEKGKKKKWQKHSSRKRSLRIGCNFQVQACCSHSCTISLSGLLVRIRVSMNLWICSALNGS